MNNLQGYQLCNKLCDFSSTQYSKLYPDLQKIAKVLEGLNISEHISLEPLLIA